MLERIESHLLYGALVRWVKHILLRIYLPKNIIQILIYIDFKIEDEIRDFCDHTANAEKIIEYISLCEYPSDNP